MHNKVDTTSDLSIIRPTVVQGGNSSVGRARPCQGRGREFESRFPLQKSHPSSILVHILEIYLLKSLVVFIGIKMEQVYSS